MIRSTIGVISAREITISNSSLVYYLDSRNLQSYSGSGTTWNDLSTSAQTTTLVNSPTYTNGILSFSDTSFEYAETNLNHPDYNNWTAEAWVKFNTSLSGKVTAVVCGEFNLSDRLNFSIGSNKAPSSYDMYVGFYDGSWRNVSSGLNPVLGQWYHIAGTYDGSTIRMYVNGLEISNFNYVGTPQSGGQIRVARRWDESSVNSSNFLGGEVPVVRVYSRALLASEVLSNYNLEKNQFGL